jgi:transcriptional regulator with XRE-family HTH domain
MSYENKSYGEVFKEMRINKRISEEEACAKVCSKSTLRCFEAGGNVIKFHTFIKLLKNIDVPTEEYFDVFDSYKIEKNNDLNHNSLTNLSIRNCSPS